MNILVTRPMPTAARTAARLRAAGHTPIVAPLLAYRGLDPVWPQSCIDGLVATSAATFDAGPPKGLALEVRRVLPLLLVGGRTEAAARAAGFFGAAIVCAESEALVATLRPDTRRRFVYLAGRDRKPYLEIAMRAGGSLQVVEAYAAEAATDLPPAARRALDAGRIGAVLHYSARSADTFIALAGAAAAGPMHLCLSFDVGLPLTAAGLPQVATAECPDEDGLFALLARLTPHGGRGGDFVP